MRYTSKGKNWPFDLFSLFELLSLSPAENSILSCICARTDVTCKLNNWQVSTYWLINLGS